MAVNQTSLSNLKPWKPGERPYGAGYRKVDPEIRREAERLLDSSVIPGATFHAELIAFACRILGSLKPTAENPQGRLPLKCEMAIINAASASVELVFNRTLGKVETPVSVKHGGDENTLALLNAIRDAIHGTNEVVNVPCEIKNVAESPCVSVLGETKMLPDVATEKTDICAGDSGKTPGPPPTT